MLPIRDLLLAAILFGAVPFILRRPHVGVLLYVWISVMNPHRLTWGFSFEMPFAATIAIATLVGAALSGEIRRLPVSAPVVAIVLVIIWTTVTTVLALDPGDSHQLWLNMIKTQTMVLLIPMLLQTKERLRHLIWVIVISLAYYGVKGGVWIVLTGGENRVWGPPGSYIQDNNALAVAIIMTIPLMRYLQLTTPYRYVRWGLMAGMLICCVAVLGSYSRGALLAVTTMIIFLWWKSRRRLPLLLVAIIAIPVALALMPDRWYDRMDTIATYDQDSSARMRLNSWGTMLNLALDRPIVGGGFAVASKEVYDRYAPDPSFPPQVAHSNYFQAIGEHGFVGLGIFIFLYLAFWRQAGSLVRTTRNRPDLAWARDFGLMLQVSMVGFAVGGAFLSLLNFDVPYFLIGALVAAKALIDRDLRAPTVAHMDGGLSHSMAGRLSERLPRRERV